MSEIDKVISRSRDVPSPQDYAVKDMRPVRQKSLADLKNHLGSNVNVELFETKLSRSSSRVRSRAAATNGTK